MKKTRDIENIKIIKRNIIIFVIFVISIGFIGILIDKLLNTSSYENIATLENKGTPGMGIWLFSPLILTFFMRTFMGDGWKDTGFLPAFKKNGK